uniref:Sodium channel regulatory subunit beta-3 n=1 Tax=Sinocyclocheilus rhinocerous TaxID=307959 RepID=A0A673KWA4_9TELE
MCLQKSVCYKVCFCLSRSRVCCKLFLELELVMDNDLSLSLFLILWCSLEKSLLVCVDVASDTEAVVGRVMKLTCIYCMKREEISAETKVDWFFIGEDKRKVLIYQFDREPQMPEDVEMYWKDRLTWKGSQDLQDISISILNVTLNDSGTYECEVSRFFEFNSFKHSTTKKTTIDLKVKMKASRDTTALYSEIMMYVLLVFLTFWLLVEMIYCYRKISKSEEQVQDTAFLQICSDEETN